MGEQFASQQQGSLALAERIGSIDELAAEFVAEVEAYLAKHVAFEAWCVENGR